MSVAFFEVTSQCPQCKAPLPLDGPRDQVICSHCLSEVSIHKGIWAGLFVGFPNQLHEFAEGGLERGKFEGVGGGEWVRGRQHPPCLSCGASTTLKESGGQIGLQCTRCGAGRPIESPTQWLRALDPNIVGVVTDPDTHAKGTAKNVAMSCKNCGGNLVVDGSSRTVDCTYCHTTNVLNDEVWRIFHPPRTLRRFWLIVRCQPYDTSTPNFFKISVNKILFVAFMLVLGGGFALAGYSVRAGYMDGRAGHQPGADSFGLVFMIIGGIVASPGILFVIFDSLLNLGMSMIVRPQNEVIGKIRLLAPKSDGAVDVEIDIVDPHMPDQALCSYSGGKYNITMRRFEKLGGNGGTVRAWRSPNNPRRNHVEMQPSDLLTK